jgi:hypothetical protein
MDRRRFIEALGRFASVGASSLLISEHLQADLQCSPYNQAGVQQCQVGIDSSIIPVMASQQMPEWCWAASISMVFRYYGFTVSQQRIVSETWGGIVNMPGGPDQILEDLNRSWKDDDDNKFTANGESYDANPITASQDLAQDMPLIIGSMGHAMVLTSLVYLRDATGRGSVQAAIVRDPWPGRGRRVLTPQEWYAAQFLARIRVEKDDDHDDN